MGWASSYIKKLKSNETVQFRPRGHSMSGKIDSGALVTVVPIASDETLGVGEIVLCRVSGAEYLHLIKALDGDRAQIGNNRGGINGWTHRSKIFGRVTQIQA